MLPAAGTGGPSTEMIPVNEPLLGERERQLVDECVTSGWVSSSGRYITEFEEGWAAYCGRRHGVAVSNGTAALEAAVAALELEPGDEVILPTFTIISCVVAVLDAGAVPVLVDSDPETWCMDADDVAARVGPRTRAIMPVHIYGHPVDMDPVLELAETARSCGRRGRRRGARGRIPARVATSRPGVAALRRLRDDEHLQLLRQQADHHR